MASELGKLKNIKYTAQDFSTIKEALSQFVQLTEPELWSDFFESNLGVVLMDLIAYVGDVQSFSLNRASEEAFPDQARRYNNMLKHTRALGYRPKIKTASSVDMSAIDPLPPQASTFGIVIPEGTEITVGNIKFTTPTQNSFAPGTPASNITFVMAQGESIEDEFVGTGANFQKYQLEIGGVVDKSWIVEVDSVVWTEVDSLFLEDATNSYSIAIDGDERLTIEFGDGINGNIPVNGSAIEVAYRVSDGLEGNITANALNSTIPVLINGNASVLGVNNPSQATGGADREDIEEIRRNMPLNLKTVDKALTKEDYDTLSTSFSDPTFGDVARTVTKLRQGTLIVHADTPPTSPVTIPAGSSVLIGNIPFTTLVEMKVGDCNSVVMVDPNSVDIYTWGFTGSTYQPISSGLKNALLTYLKERSIITTTLFIKDGLNKSINIDLGTVKVFRNFDIIQVEADVRENITSYFTSIDINPGDPFVLSDLYNIVENTAGVDKFIIQSPLTDITTEDIELIVEGIISALFEYNEQDVPDFTANY